MPAVFLFLCFATSCGMSDMDKAVECCFLSRSLFNCILEAEILTRIQRNKLIFVDNINYLDKGNELANGITL